MTNGRKIAAAVLVGLGALVYGISPIDFIPELLTGPLGFADDLAVVGGAAFAIWKLLTGGKPGATAPTPPAGTTPPPAA
jgi:uncharacterized membrane protein YkvA (DUF1232 family)